MSKKAVIVPKYKWCNLKLGEDYAGFNFHNSRKKARIWSNATCGTVRKVTKIVYYYE